MRVPAALCYFSSVLYPLAPSPSLSTCLRVSSEPLTTLGPVLCYAFRSAPYIDHALSAFGFDRCLAEGNWFVSDRMGDPYSRVFQLLKDACDRAVRTQTPSAQPSAVAPLNTARGLHQSPPRGDAEAGTLALSV